MYNNQSTILTQRKKTIQININQLLCLMPFTFLNLKQESLHLKVFTIANPCTLKGIWGVLVLDLQQ